MKYRVTIETMCTKCGEIENRKRRTFRDEWEAEQWMVDEHDRFLAREGDLVLDDDFDPCRDGYMTFHLPHLQTQFFIEKVG